MILKKIQLLNYKSISSLIMSSTAGSSIVDGILYSTPLEILRIVPRKILPLRVFGNF